LFLSATGSFAAEAGVGAPEDMRKVAAVKMPAPEVGAPPPIYLDPDYIKAMELSAPMAEALNKYAPDFKQWGIADYPPEQIKHYPYSGKSLPYAVKGDFNGDGIEDVAIAGHNRDSNLVMVLISSGNADYNVLTAKEDKYYTAHKQGEEIPYTATEALVLKKSGTSLVEGDMSPVVTILKTDAFSSKGINRFDRAGYTFKQGCTGINTYEYAAKFVASYSGSVSKSTPAVSGRHFRPEYIEKMSLPAKMSEALRAYNKDFDLWKPGDYPESRIAAYPYSEKSLPYFVSGDFNGDGRKDIVLSGHDKDANITLALMSSSSSYYPLEISIFPCYKLAKKHKKELPYTPTDSIELSGEDGFKIRQINTWGLEDSADDYSDYYKLTGNSGQVISYKYVKKLFKHSGPEDECIDKGAGTPW